VSSTVSVDSAGDGVVCPCRVGKNLGHGQRMRCTVRRFAHLTAVHLFRDL
jgi:hypothetical protein